MDEAVLNDVFKDMKTKIDVIHYENYFSVGIIGAISVHSGEGGLKKIYKTFPIPQSYEVVYNGIEVNSVEFFKWLFDEPYNMENILANEKATEEASTKKEEGKRKK